MTRVRWLAAKWSTTIRSIGTKMKAAEFKPGASDGFIVERTRESLIEGQYIEKTEFEEAVIDPFGVEQRITRIDYRKTRFVLRADFPQIEIWDAPRSVQGFVSRLGEFNTFNLTVSSIEADLNKWLEAFRRQVDTRVEISGIQAGEIVFGDGVVGKVFLKGGDAADRVLKSLLKTRKYRVERVLLKVEHGSKWNGVRLGKDATASCTGVALAETFESIRNSLTEAVIR